MYASISVNLNPDVNDDEVNKKVKRINKGKSLLKILSDYIVIDIETTGLCAEIDEIIEICALKINENIVVDTFHSLIKPTDEIPDFITELTGITDEMVKDSPCIENVLPDFIKFIGDSVLVGHNVNFDINFLYDYCEYNNYILKNDFIDTMRMARRIIPELEHHRLKDVAEYFDIPYENAHRSVKDCNITYQCYIKLCKIVNSNPDILINLHKPHQSVRAKDISMTVEVEDVDTSNPFYNKICVITGSLDKILRKEAMQIIANLGGINADTVTKKTNYLILGNNDYCTSIKNGKSNKHKKAEEYLLKGQDIQIIPESVFYDMLEYD